METLPEEWIRAAARGDTGAFERIYEATSGLVYSIALRITGDREDAEEVAQDVYLKAFRELANFRYESSLSTWLYRIAVNRAISVSRKSRRRRARQVAYDDAREVAGGRSGGAEAMEREHREEQVRSLLNTLNPDQRACIMLREIEGMRYAEIAELLGIRINTVRSRLRRARLALVSLAERKRSTA